MERPRRHEVRRKARRHEEVGGASPEAGGAVVRVLPLVGGDHRRRVLVRTLHPFLHAALGRRAPVVAPAHMSSGTPSSSRYLIEHLARATYERMHKFVPWVCAVLDGLLAILAPAVAVLEVIDLALGEEGDAG